jgi:carbonic anhydrase
MLPLLLMLGGGGAVAAVVFLAMRAERERNDAARELAGRIGWSFQETAGMEVVPGAERFELFTQGRDRKVRRFLSGRSGGMRAALFDYSYTVGAGKSQSTWTQTVACIHARGLSLPLFSVRPEGIFHRLAERFGYQDIDLDASPAFSRAFLLRGPDEAAVREVFTPPVARWFERTGRVCCAGEGQVLYLWRPGQRVRSEEMEGLLDEAVALAGAFQAVPAA